MKKETITSRPADARNAARSSDRHEPYYLDEIDKGGGEEQEY
jgi:hypothetical protein